MIVGAGAIGGTVGAVLTRAGVSAVLIARGRHAEVLAGAGLTLRTPDGTFPTPVTGASRPEDVRLTDDDVLVFATKTQQLDAALQDWVDRPVHGPDGVVGTAGERLPAMTALNGVAAEEKSLRYFRRVFGVCVWLPAVHLEPGEVIVRSWPVVGQFHVARWSAVLSSSDDADFLARLSRQWSGAGIRVRLPEDVAPWKYNKLLSNLGNAVGALTAQTNDAREVVAAVRMERGTEQLHLAVLQPQHRRHRDRLPQRGDRPHRSSARHRGAAQRGAGPCGAHRRPQRAWAGPLLGGATGRTRRRRRTFPRTGLTAPGPPCPTPRGASGSAPIPISRRVTS